MSVSPSQFAQLSVLVTHVFVSSRNNVQGSSLYPLPNHLFERSN
jgi:hypothetical protein